MLGHAQYLQDTTSWQFSGKFFWPKFEEIAQLRAIFLEISKINWVKDDGARWRWMELGGCAYTV